MPDTRLRRIARGEGLVEQAAELMAGAFAQDPAMNNFVSGEKPAGRGPLRVKIARLLIQTHLAGLGEVWGWFEGERLIGCALVDLRPGAFAKGLAYLRTLPGWLRLPQGTLKRLNTYGAASQKGIPGDVACFLTMIGVSPGAQGQGHGGKFLRAIEAAKGEGTVWALDTENPDNVGLYEHMGYALYERLELPDLCLYKMRKPTRKKAAR